MRAAGAGVALLLAAVAAPVASAASVDGIWGAVTEKGVQCSGTRVMVLRYGRYTKAMLDLGTTLGPRDIVEGTASYRIDGARLTVAPSLSLLRPEPRQVFLWDPAGQTLLRQEPPPSLTFGRCPDRELRPLDG